MMNPTRLLMFLSFVVSQGATREYRFVQLSKTWPEAQSYCREHFRDLATITSEEEWNRARSVSGGAMAWIGLHSELTEWKWSINDTEFSTDDNMGNETWFNLNTYKPPDLAGCVMFHNKELYDTNCTSRLKPVCYDESNNTYIPVTKVTNFWTVESYCREKYTGLASVRTQQEKQRILDVIDTTQWWIGLSRRRWFWSEQIFIVFRKWRGANPDGNGDQCVVADSVGWDDVPCTRSHSFICSVPNMMLVKFVLKPEGPVDMNDPVVQEAIRKHIEKLMKDGGIQEFRLRWRKQPNETIFTKIKSTYVNTDYCTEDE